MIIKKIKIKNFKGTLEREIDFGTKQNIISGENGIGKTTILDAITWTLFGKDFQDRQQFKIKPIIDNVEKTDLTTSVELVINQGNDITIERIWENSQTTLLVDGTNFKVNEFKKFLEEKLELDENEFKALTSVEYIPNLHWKDLRSLIISLVGDVTNEEILSSGEYDLIKDKINSVGVDMTSRDIKDSKTTINDKVKQITGNIDEKTKDIEQLTVDPAEEIRLKEELEGLKKQQQDYEELSKKEFDRQQEINNKINEKSKLETEISNLKYKIELEEQKLANYSINFENKKANDISGITREIDGLKNLIKLQENHTEALKKERLELEKKYDEISNAEIKVTNDNCPSCLQKLPEEKIKDTLNKLREQQVADAQAIVAIAKEKLEMIENNQEVIKIANNDIADKLMEIEEIKLRKLNPDEMTNEQKEISSNIDNFKSQLETKEVQIMSNYANIEVFVSKVDNSTISTINERIRTIIEQLAASKVLETFKGQLTTLETTRKNYLAEKEVLNEKEQQLIQFNNKKAEILRERVKGHFNIADFIVEEYTKDGDAIETFKIASEGVEYSNLNYGKKILIALDLITGIQKLKNKPMPILVDGLGELTKLPFLETQLIGCRAVKGVERINVRTKEKEED